MTPDAMDVYRYPGRTVGADYVRAFAGAAITFGPIAIFGVAAPVVYILGGFGTLFVAFGVRTVFRHLTRVELTAHEIRVMRPARAALRWQDIDSMTLSYYSTRRDRQGGWMQLKLKGANRVLKLDSTIEGFQIIAQHAFRAARNNRLALSRATLANLSALGLTSEVDDEFPANA